VWNTGRCFLWMKPALEEACESRVHWGEKAKCELWSCDPNIQNKACLWDKAGVEGKSSRGGGTRETDNV